MNFINNDQAPKAIGPYSQAVQVGNLIFCSGQTPVNPETMKIETSDVGLQTKRALANLELVLQAKGLSLQQVVRTNVYLTSMKHFAEMNAAYESVFGAHRPVRTTVAVLELPLGALVEIECVAEVQN